MKHMMLEHVKEVTYSTKYNIITYYLYNICENIHIKSKNFLAFVQHFCRVYLDHQYNTVTLGKGQPDPGGAEEMAMGEANPLKYDN